MGTDGKAPLTKRLGRFATGVLRVAGFAAVVIAWFLLPAGWSWGGLLPLMLSGFFLVFGLAFQEPRDLLGFIACVVGTVAGGFFMDTSIGPIVFFASIAVAFLVVGWEVAELVTFTPLGD